MLQTLLQDRKGPRALRRGAGSRLWRPHLAGRGLRALRALPIAVSVLAAAGCATRTELGFMSLMSEVPVGQAVILPPPGGPAVIAVLQRRYPNGLTQEVALATASAASGQNAFYVNLAKEAETAPENVESLRIRRLTQETVQNEMADRLPGIDMRTSLLYAQNKYGPFGFATGRSAAGDTCLYAWQQIEPNAPALFFPGGTISVRLRLCDADATEEQLLRTMYAYTISAYFLTGTWNPYGTPPAPPSYLGETNAPIFPLGMMGGESPFARTQPSLSPSASRVTRAVRVRRVPVDKDTVAPAPAPAVPVPAAPTGPLEGYPVVPAPPSP